MKQIICDHLMVGYGNRTVLSDLTFSIHAGEYLCITGENGAGKSTLMRTLLGLQKPLAGTLQYKDGIGKKGIGYLPQQMPIQKDFPASVREIVRSGCLGNMKWRPYYSRREKEKAEENMKRLQIGALASACYRELSGGQQQRVLLARALCAAGSMLFLDEPVTGLDPETAEELYDIIQTLHQSGMTIVMITHDVARAVNDAMQVLHLGRDRFWGSAAAYRQSETGRAFLSRKRRDTVW